MTEQATTRGSLFAAKGDAAPSPSVGNATFHGLESRAEPSAQKTSWIDPGPRFRIPGLETASPVEPAPPPSTLSALIRRRDGVTPVSASV